MLEPAKTAFDQIAIAVALAVQTVLVPPVRVRRDKRLGLLPARLKLINSSQSKALSTTAFGEAFVEHLACITQERVERLRGRG